MRKIALIIFVLMLLVSVRIFETSLFYDPLHSFFNSDFALLPLPEMNEWKLLLHVGFRYMCNTILSLAMLYLVFENREILKVSLLLYGILFLVGMIVFSLLLKSTAIGDHLPLFYVRRFLIQPLFLLILLPAFYVYQKE